jgi:hypothetical protein
MVRERERTAGGEGTDMEESLPPAEPPVDFARACFFVPSGNLGECDPVLSEVS